MTAAASGLTIGQVCARTGLSVHTLRLYEREGLFAGEVRRDGRGRRVYSAWDVEWLEYCMRFRASGMPLATIRRFAELVRQGVGNEHIRLKLLREHRDVVVERIAELTACLEVIDFKVGVYEEHLAQGNAGDLWGPP
ncbi:MerR family transcriptional regulator [Catellatospora sichuanensis]|uniref:MerR family transcriptional regulator n=1 Tax=Catellatospora sichuanensis TaxID=1969805 RepID=UPI001181E9E0|nr:MerR family transcriptional regulator [Catellatospora sichuanensis]